MPRRVRRTCRAWWVARGGPRPNLVRLAPCKGGDLLASCLSAREHRSRPLERCLRRRCNRLATTLPPQSSIDDLALIDLPATIDFVLKTTGRKKLSLVGHSQGGTLPLMLLSSKVGTPRRARAGSVHPACLAPGAQALHQHPPDQPSASPDPSHSAPYVPPRTHAQLEYNDKVALMVLMGPVTYAKHLVAAYLRQQALTGSAKSMLSDAGVRRCSRGRASGRPGCGRRGGWWDCGAWLLNPAKRQFATRKPRSKPCPPPLRLATTLPTRCLRFQGLAATRRSKRSPTANG